MSLITNAEQQSLNAIWLQLVQLLGYRPEVLTSMGFGDLVASIVDPTGEVTLTGTQNLSNKTFTDVLKCNAATNQVALGAAGHLVTISATAPVAATQLLTIPDTAGADTFAFLAATQELTHKTLTAPVMKNGLTASGTAAYDFTGASGDFKLPTGVLTWAGANTKGASLTSGVAMAGSAHAFILDTLNDWTTGDNLLEIKSHGVVEFQFGKRAAFAYPTLTAAGTALGLFCDPDNAFGASGWSIQQGAIYGFVGGQTTKFSFDQNSFHPQNDGSYSVGIAGQAIGTVRSKKLTIETAAALPLWWSVVDSVNSGNITAVDAASDNTVGQQLMFTQQGTVTGARIYWAGGVGAQTITIDLWTGGASVATATVAVNAAGVYSVTFGSPYTIDSTKLATKFYLTMWSGGTGHYSYVSTANWQAGNGPLPNSVNSEFYAGNHLYVKSAYAYNAGGGHSVPDSVITTNISLIEPKFTT